MPQRNACPSIYLGSRSDLQAQFEQLALEDEEEEREDERKREELRGSFSTMKLSTQTVDRFVFLFFVFCLMFLLFFGFLVFWFFGFSLFFVLIFLVSFK